jgi:hypothetical protein
MTDRPITPLLLHGDWQGGVHLALCCDGPTLCGIDPAPHDAASVCSALEDGGTFCRLCLHYIETRVSKTRRLRRAKEAMKHVSE